MKSHHISFLESPVFPVAKLHTFANILNGKTPSSDDRNWGGDIPFVTPPDLNGLDGKEITSVDRRITDLGLRNSSRLVEKGVIFSCRAPVGYVGRITSPSVFNQGCKVIVTDQDHRYVAYALAASKTNLQALANGTTFSEISTTAVENYAIPLPTLATQRRIADYLDRETAEIDSAVGELDRYIELLTERRRVVISQAVCGQLGPGLDSAASWSQVPLLSAAANGGLFVDGDWVESKDQDPAGSIRLTQLADIGDSVFLDKSDRWINNSTFSELKCTEVLPGDLLIARMPDPIARCTLAPEGLGYPLITVVDVAILRPGAEWDNHYLMWTVNSIPFRNDVESRVSGATRQRISRSALGRTTIRKPALEIQQRIADYIDRETAEMDSLIAKSTKLRDLLLKRRSVLISDVVTGRKQV